MWPSGRSFPSCSARTDVSPEPVDAHILQPGCRQVAAGYVIYGGSTVLAYTTGHGVHMFTLDPAIGAFVLHQENIRIPEIGKTYSINEAYDHQFPGGIQALSLLV